MTRHWMRRAKLWSRGWYSASFGHPANPHPAATAHQRTYCPDVHLRPGVLPFSNQQLGGAVPACGHVLGVPLPRLAAGPRVTRHHAACKPKVTMGTEGGGSACTRRVSVLQYTQVGEGSCVRLHCVACMEEVVGRDQQWQAPLTLPCSSSRSNMSSRRRTTA